MRRQRLPMSSTGRGRNVAIYSLRLMPIGKTTQRRAFTAAAHLRYITRSGAVSHAMAERMPESRVAAMRWLRAGEVSDRANARVADKLVIALPRELDLGQQVQLVHRFAEDLTEGRASWFAAIHANGKDRDNPHVHLLIRDRDVITGRRVVMFSAGAKEIAQRVAAGQKPPTTLRVIRALWERKANEALAEAGSSARIDARSLLDQGVLRHAQVHEGPNVRAMHARGVRPVSKERKRKARAMSRKDTPAERNVRYPEIDGGVSRVEYNLALRDAPEMSLTEAARRQARAVRATPTTAPGYTRARE